MRARARVRVLPSDFLGHRRGFPCIARVKGKGSTTHFPLLLFFFFLGGGGGLTSARAQQSQTPGQGSVHSDSAS